MKSKLQKEFRKFHESIKLNNEQHDKGLREKRDMLFKELQDWLKKNDKPSVEFVNQGSYAMGTGIKPPNDSDYDLDVALKFNIKIDDYSDPTTVKKWVEQAFSQQENRTVDMKEPCVRVQYHRNNSTWFHLDFAVYGRDNKDSLQLARGKKGSQEKNKYWEVSDIEALKEKINGKFSEEEERKQFKRVIRYLKRWKDVQFSSNGNGKPTGIALTAMAYQWFEPSVVKEWNGELKIDDCSALKSLLESICQNNYGLDTTLPVPPQNDLLDKITATPRHEKYYREKMEAFKDTIQRVHSATSLKEATTLLKEQLGDTFKVVEGSNPGIVSSTEAS